MPTADAGVTPLTFEDVAYLLCGGDIDPPEATLARLTPHLRSDPRLADQVRDLDRLTREAGAELPFEAVRAEALLEQLLAEEGWQHPSEVTPADVLEVYYPRLIRLASLRAERAENPEPLLALRERLVTAQADLEAGDELLESMIERLLALSPDVAERVLACIVSRYRLRHNGWDRPDGDRPGEAAGP